MGLETWPDNLGALLATAGRGTVGTTIFVGQFPADFSPSSSGLLLVPTSGRPSGPDGLLVYPRVQITARNSVYATAWALAWAVYGDLAERAATALGSSQACLIKPLQVPSMLPPDERGAWRAVCNYEFTLNEN